MNHHYIVILPAGLSKSDEQRAIEDTQYKGYLLEKVVDCPTRKGVRLAHFNRYIAEPPDGA